MSAQFWPCPGCSRHVKRGDAVCPFCGASASVERDPTRVLAATRLSRAALFAGAMGTAVATADCASPAVPYGLPPLGSAMEDSSASNIPAEAAPDASDGSTSPGLTDSSSTADALMAVPIYGAAVGPDE